MQLNWLWQWLNHALLGGFVQHRGLGQTHWTDDLLNLYFFLFTDGLGDLLWSLEHLFLAADGVIGVGWLCAHVHNLLKRLLAIVVDGVHLKTFLKVLLVNDGHALGGLVPVLGRLVKLTWVYFVRGALGNAGVPGVLEGHWLELRFGLEVWAAWVHARLVASRPCDWIQVVLL